MDEGRNVRICRRCKGDRAKVVDVRERGGMVRRWRRCACCGYKWTTVEVGYWDYEAMRTKLEKMEGTTETAKKE